MATSRNAAIPGENAGHVRSMLRPAMNPGRGPAPEAQAEAPEATDARERETGFREPHPEPPAEDHGESQGDPHAGETNPES